MEKKKKDEARGLIASGVRKCSVYGWINPFQKQRVGLLKEEKRGIEKENIA